MQLCFAPFAVGFSCKSEKMDRNLLDRARICYYNSMAVEVIAIIRSLVNTVWYRSGDVCERCRWQKKRAKRSGRGRTKSSANGCEDFFGVPQQDITGLVPLKEKLNSRLHSFRSLTYTVWYRSGDVCERCRWQKKRAKRSGRGRTKSSANGCEDFFGVPQQDITGLVPLKEKLNSRLHSFRSLTYTVWYRSGHNGTDSKSVVPHGTVGSNPTHTARKKQ